MGKEEMKGIIFELRWSLKESMDLAIELLNQRKKPISDEERRILKTCQKVLDDSEKWG